MKTLTYLTLSNIHKSYYGVTILENIDLTLNEGDKIAIVGRNGAGKSTLAQIIVGENPTIRDILRVKGLSSAISRNNGSSIPTKRSTRHCWVSWARTGNWTGIATTHWRISQNESRRYIRTIQSTPLHFEIGGYTYHVRVESVLNRFGFRDFYHHRVDTLSGGEKTRLALAKLLLEEWMCSSSMSRLPFRFETTEYLENF